VSHPSSCSLRSPSCRAFGLLLALSAAPLATVEAQECLGLHRARPVTTVEFTAHRQPSYTAVGVGLSRGALFVKAETATDPVTGGDLLSTKRIGATAGLQATGQRASACVAAVYRHDELEAVPSVRSEALGVTLGYGYRIIAGARPVILFGQAHLESRTDELTGDFARRLGEATGSGVRAGAAYRYAEWVGVRAFVDVREGGTVGGASLSLSPRRRAAR
jgi:hypothetical protein